MARPRIELTEEMRQQIIELSAVRCTQDEAAFNLGISPSTFDRWLKHKDIRALWERGEAQGKMSLRRAQFETALAGNPTMLIWLGKLMLGQVDPSEKKDEEQRPTKVFMYPAKVTSKEEWLQVYGTLGEQQAAGDTAESDEGSGNDEETEG